MEISADENYPNEPHRIEFLRIIINFIKEIQEFEEYTKKQLNELKYLIHAQVNKQKITYGCWK